MVEHIQFGQSELRVSEVVLGTWVTGGWAWGGSDEAESLRAIHRALDLGVNFIDTAPVYGFGKSEEIVGKALKEWNRPDDVVIATKCGLDWNAQQTHIRRNSTPERIRKEVDDSLRRLGVNRIDLYQIHWPDPKVPFQLSIEAMVRLQEEGKIRYIGLSNFNREQIAECLGFGMVHSLQPPFNVFEREAEKELLPFCREKGIATLVYGGLCRGLLSGKFTGEETFSKGDLRRGDPKFKPDRFKQYVKAADALKKIAAKYGKTLAQFALRWALQQPGVTTVIAGSRTVAQVEDNVGVSGWRIEPEDTRKVDDILQKFIKTPVGPEFMAPGMD
jgi:aryl-alcohol dehydrogenase-like predicted oxidoreductase